MPMSAKTNNMNRPDVTRPFLAWLIASLLIIGVFMACNAQCITDYAPYPQAAFSQCYEDSLNVTEQFTVYCPSWYHGGSYVYEFYSDGINPIIIVVDSELEYTSCPLCDVWAHAFITDGCQGETLWSTTASCPTSPLVYVISDSSPSQDWTLAIQLPEGLFHFHIGNVGAWQVQDSVLGCYDLLIGTFGLLNLGIYKYNPLVSNRNEYLYTILGQRK